jgi:hypothetical protein
MDISESYFCFSWPDHVPVIAQIEWTLPSTYDVLFSGLIQEDATAYFYAIVSFHKKEWITHYIGKVYAQRSSQRHRATDHIKRLSNLKKSYPGRAFHLTLGTPIFSDRRENPDSLTIDQIEGLLIYSNWSENMINVRKINSFSSSQEMSLENVGFNKHLWKRSAYGVFSSNE